MNTKALGLALAASLIASVPAAAQDWSGFYAGVYAGNISGDWQHLNPDGSVYNSGPYSSDRIAGAFAGYNLQRGNMVYGGELAAGRSGDFCFEEFPPECTDTFVDLKGRVGYSTGSVLVYGVLGVSRAVYHNGTDDFTLSGLAYGLGVDYAITDRFFAGGEVLRRNLDNDEFLGTLATEHDVTTVTVRLGMKF